MKRLRERIGALVLADRDDERRAFGRKLARRFVKARHLPSTDIQFFGIETPRPPSVTLTVDDLAVLLALAYEEGRLTRTGAKRKARGTSRAIK